MVDCAAVSPGLRGSGLFGHERGAFPGAFDRQPGRLVQADGGSIIIDHVECITLETQAQLVEVMNSGEVQMIGGASSPAYAVHMMEKRTSQPRSDRARVGKEGGSHRWTRWSP